MPYDYTLIRAQWDAYTRIRVRFCDTETGYAVKLDDTHVCVANLPFTCGLMMYDIVTLDYEGDGPPLVDEVVQRYHATQVGLQYVAEDMRHDVEACKRIFTQIATAAVSAGCDMEWLLPGLAMLNAPAGVSIANLLESVGLDPSWVEVYEQGQT